MGVMARLPQITPVAAEFCDSRLMELLNYKQMIILMTMRLIIMTL